MDCLLFSFIIIKSINDDMKDSKKSAMPQSESLLPPLPESMEGQLENPLYSEIVAPLKHHPLLFVFAEARLQWIMTDSRDHGSQGGLVSGSKTYNLLITLLKTKQTKNSQPGITPVCQEIPAVNFPIPETG